MRLLPFLRYTLIMAFVTVSFLFAPRPHSIEEYCGTFYPIGHYMGFVINCDSYEFVRVSVHPPALFEAKSIRQSRPLFVIAGSALGYTLYPLLSLLHLNIYESHFAAFLLINFLILLLSLWLLDRILIGNTTLDLPARSAFQLLLISNIVTKTFFWTAHQQMFTILTPLLCIYLMQWLTDHRSASAICIASLSFLCGLALLVYGNFVLLAICILSALLYYRYTAKAIAISALLIALPTITWLLILKCKGVAYYNHEVTHYHQFVWVAESLRTSFSTFVSAAHGHWMAFRNTFTSITVILLMLILLAAYRTFAIRSISVDRSVVPISLYLMAITFVFLYLMGFYQDRLTYMLFSPAVVLGAVFFSDITFARGRLSIAFLLTAVLLWHVYTVTSYGPFI